MLTHLSVQNFTLVDSLELELHQGMTVITGETGAGKSILLDALGLTLGDRADPDRVRSGCERADLSATFDLTALPRANHWLQQHDLDQGPECILRRSLTKEGRSRGFINGHPVPLGQLKELGEMLIDIHSQHAHQSLLKKETHRRLLDDFGQHSALTQAVREAYRHWQTLQEKFDHWRLNAEELTARIQLLRYQLEELDALGLEPGELEQLEQEQRQLASADSILQVSHAVRHICDNEEGGLATLLHKALHQLHSLTDKPDALAVTDDLLQSALIQIQEAEHEIGLYIDSFEIDPERLTFIEERLSSCYEIARKHRIQADELLSLQAALHSELAQIGDSETQLDELEAQANTARSEYLHLAQQLSEARHATAATLEAAINERLHSLAMRHANLSIAIEPAAAPSRHGVDDIEFLVSTNPGQPAKALGKVASGGELSRISLAIQVVTAQNSATPTLVFDEVDVGIGGATADVVGELLRSLGSQGQVLCVTHLAQVASKGHHHLQVNKTTDEHQAQTTLTPLTQADKVMELARMMGGAQLTQQTIAHAQEMLELVG